MKPLGVGERGNDGRKEGISHGEERDAGENALQYSASPDFQDNIEIIDVTEPGYVHFTMDIPACLGNYHAAFMAARGIASERLGRGLPRLRWDPTTCAKAPASISSSRAMLQG